MNGKAVKTLEYNKILNMLSAKAGSIMTRQVIENLMPMTDERRINEGLDRTQEAVTLMINKGPLPLGNFYDIGDSVSLAQKGGILSMEQLLKIGYNMKIAEDTVAYLKGDLPPLPMLGEMCGVLELFRDLREEIQSAILSETEMDDNASPELKSIRREIVRSNEAIRVKIDRIVNSQENRTALQDAIVTIRDGRYVIPVKAEHRGKFPGIVHDQSGSGQTLFIEPQAVVDLNNKLKELAVEEQAEITRILQDFSERVAACGERLKNNQKLLVELDFINAKGRLALDMGGERPVIVKEGELILKEARHPLIDREKAVPVSLTIGGSYDTLIITGPNTGGKTVCLKTTGLLVMMAQTGLHIPAAGSSRIPVFENVYGDIGDEQSIEQSLSTFSSHMRNIVEIVGEAGPGTLVLLDELGAGTDPAEGAALAIAILRELSKKKARILATTHYTELKKYALSAAGVENASMEFDVEALSPTYKLIMGIPGRSNAFEIAGKLGLDGEIIDEAGRLMESGDIEFQDVLTAIEKDRRAAEAERDAAIELKVAMDKEKEKLDREREKFTKEKERLLRDAKREAADIVAEAKEITAQTREEMRQITKLQSQSERNRRFEAGRKRVKDAAGRYRETVMKEVNNNPVRIEDVRKGDRVKVLTLGQNGEILTLPDEDEMLMVRVGRMKVKVKADDLMIIPDGRSIDKSKTRYGSMYKSKAQTVRATVDVRGENMDSAADMVEKYLDDVYMAGLPQVTIIHGRGEGVLKKGIREILKRHKNVDSFRGGKYDEGGEGVTIVDMKSR